MLQKTRINYPPSLSLSTCPDACQPYSNPKQSHKTRLAPDFLCIVASSRCFSFREFHSWDLEGREIGMTEAEMSSRNRRWSLQGMTALVTGGSRGIGQVTCINFALPWSCIYPVVIVTATDFCVNLIEYLGMQLWKNWQHLGQQFIHVLETKRS